MSLGPNHWNQHYAALRALLLSLRAVFPAGAKAETYRSLFDEFLANREFGLALEVLCDFLLEPDVQSFGDVELNEIAQLHSIMKVEDQCFLRLRQKLNGIESINESR